MSCFSVSARFSSSLTFSNFSKAGFLPENPSVLPFVFFFELKKSGSPTSFMARSISEHSRIKSTAATPAASLPCFFSGLVLSQSSCIFCVSSCSGVCSFSQNCLAAVFLSFRAFAFKCAYFAFSLEARDFDGVKRIL